MPLPVLPSNLNTPLRRSEACAQDGERVVEEYIGAVVHRLVRECGCVVIRVTRPTWVSVLSDGGDPVWQVLIEQEFPCESCVRSDRYRESTVPCACERCVALHGEYPEG